MHHGNHIYLYVQSLTYTSLSLYLFINGLATFWRSDDLTWCISRNQLKSIHDLFLHVSLPVLAANQNHSRSTTPTAMDSTRPAPAQSRWRPCHFTRRYWSITCRRSRLRHVELRARPRPLPCPGRERGNERGNERGSGLSTAKERKATGERGVRGNWCSWRTEWMGGGEKEENGGEGKWGGSVLFVDSQRRRMEDERGKRGGVELSLDEKIAPLLGNGEEWWYVILTPL